MEDNPYSTPPVDKAQLLSWIATEHDLLEGVLARLNAEQMEEPALAGGWSAKDTLAHITAWEGRLLKALRAKAEGDVTQIQQLSLESESEPTDDVNERWYMESKETPLPDVRRDFNRSYEEVLRELEAVPEAGLLEPGRAEWFNAEPLRKLVADNTFEHYREHREALERWLAERAGDGE